MVEVLEGPDGRLSVQHEGHIVASREAPPRAGILRSFGTRTVACGNPSIVLTTLNRVMTHTSFRARPEDRCDGAVTGHIRDSPGHRMPSLTSDQRSPGPPETHLGLVRYPRTAFFNTLLVRKMFRNRASAFPKWSTGGRLRRAASTGTPAA